MGFLTKFLFYFSHHLRQHPFRFLIGGKLFSFFSSSEPGEEEVYRRAWPGPIWDIGASLGKYTVVLAEANPNQRVYAFEPNLNSLYYLGYRTAKYPNVVIVPALLTVDARFAKTTYDPNFVNPPTGPQAIAFPLEDALRWFGVPAFIKLDIEGFEYEFLERCGPLLKNSTLLVEWHPVYNGVPNSGATKYKPDFSHWKATKVSPNHTLFEPLLPAAVKPVQS